MKVVFLENVPNIATAGEVKTVKDGFGRNFLLPRKLAAIASPAVLKHLEEQEKALAKKEARLGAQATQLGESLNGTTVAVDVKVGTQGRLYGAVTNARIAEELAKVVGHEVDRRRVLLVDPIKQLGTYQVEVRFSNDVSATINVEVREAGKAEA